ncbi:NAD(P)-dependent dehydrogenase, short-chain alcohol dehydrogenase family [Duganella sp. CF517]|uniref:SDR family NAD(P)-dependent oxidoreductase n=1 Tax=Duganella sp. CF517 TaxID=1881038 RepID=UPI0008BACBD2|nr:SDR family NAD(P)-dependent oxidoreductase [Duganella sp. CF517]SEO64549.1 NAD(P)-dependent dehydrogenase, short-chain alcohol dehydrogenase family [Duganella sp. CF517]
MHPLAQKIALVTGASRGIGAAIAVRLADDGADVAFTYASDEGGAAATLAAIEGRGRKGLAIRANNKSAGEVEAAVAQTIAAFGRIDILVNNAGIYRPGTIDTLTLGDFDDTIAINLRAAFVASKAVAAAMASGGRIISIGSNLAVRAPGQGMSIYTASKAALTGLSQGMARDLGPRGITVNVVHPGSTDTDMNPADGPHAGAQRNLMATGGAAYAAPSEVAGVVAFLASPQAQSVTGAAWTIDNGANA